MHGLRRFLSVLILAMTGIAAPSYAVQDSATQKAKCEASLANSHAWYKCLSVSSCTYVEGSPSTCYSFGFAGGCGAWTVQGCAANTSASYFGVADSCSGGKSWSWASGSCVCPKGTYSSGGQCVPEPTCAAGQHVDSSTHTCVPDSPAPQPGASKRVPVDVGQSDGGNWCVGGCTYPATVNSEGWEYEVGLYVPIEQGGGCSVVSGRVICYFDSSATGNPAAPSSPVVSPTLTGSPSPSDPVTPSPGCPVGYFVDANGNCKSPDQPGQPSTSQSPAGPSSPGGTTCPIGYSLDATGRCVGTPGQGTFGCPSGYTYSNGQCVGGTAAQPVRSTEPCGAPGQPSCAVTVSGPSDYMPITNAGPSQSDQEAADGAFQGVLSTIANWVNLDPAKSDRDSFVSLWADWIEPVPSSACQPFVATINGNSWTWDHCPVAEKISIIGNFAMWIYFSIGVFMLVIGAKREGA